VLIFASFWLYINMIKAIRHSNMNSVANAFFLAINSHIEKANAARKVAFYINKLRSPS